MSNEIVLQLDPTPNNPRNSEGSFVTFADGRIMFAYSRFTGGGGDADAADIAAIYSPDGGRTWSEPAILVPNQGEENTMSVSLLRLADGRIALFYLVKNGLHDCCPRMCISDDEGKTWSEPRPTIPVPGYFVVNNDRVVQLSGGRLIIPASYHRIRAGEAYGQWRLDSRGIAIYYYSDDLGQTWRESATWWALPMESSAGLQEPGLIELRDGSLFSWCRTSVGRQYGLTSQDGGEHWSPPEPTEFISPCSPLSMKRIPSTGDLLAIWNDRSGRFPLPAPAKESWERTPLVSAISRDEGKTWEHHRLIEDDPERGFCYTAIHFTDDTVLLAYCAGGKPTGSVLNTLRIRRVSVEWFYEAA